MKIWFNASAFLISLALGVFAAVVTAWIPGDAESFRSLPLSGTVEIRFISWEMKEGYPFAKFSVINGLNESLTYGAFSRNAPPPIVKVDGQQLRFMHCGTGHKDFSIASGETAVFEVAGYYFRDGVNPESRVEVGFWMRPGMFAESEYFGSKSTQLPADLLAAVAASR